MGRRNAGIVLAALVVAYGGWRLYDKPATFQGTRYRYSLASGGPSLEEQKAFYRKRIESNPRGFLDLAHLASLLVQEARSTGETRLYDEAETLAQRSIASFSSHNPGALSVLAEVAEARHDFPKAIELSKKLLATDSRSLSALSTLTTSSLALGDNAKAAEYADRLLDTRPTLGAYTAHGLVCLARGKDDEALNDFRQAIRVEDAGEVAASAWVRALLGRYFLSRGQLRMADAYLGEALRIDPHHAMALGLMGDLALEKGQERRALSFYTEAFQKSGATTFLTKRATILKRRGEIEESERIWSHAEKMILKEIQAGRYGHPHDLVQLILDRGRPGEIPAAVQLARAAAKKRHDPATLLVLLRAYHAAQMWKEGKEVAREILRTGVEDPMAYLYAGIVSRAAGDRVRASFFLTRALSLNPRLASAHAELSRAYPGMNPQPVARSTAQTRATPRAAQEPPRKQMRAYQY